MPIKINHRWLVLFIHALFLPFFILAIARYFSGAGADLHNIVITLLGISALGVWSLALLRELKQCSSAAIKEDS